MAVTKIHAIKSTLSKAIAYIETHARPMARYMFLATIQSLKPPRLISR